MFTWGEDSQGGFRVKKGSASAAGDGVYFLKLGFHIKDLSAGHSALAFVKSDGNAFIIRTNESNDGRRVRGNQKSLKYEEKIQSVSCGDDVVTLLSETGRVLYVDSAHPPFTPRPLEVLCNIPVSQVACGSQHSVALTKDGQVYTWGQDSRGQLGLGRRKLGANSPQHLRSLSSIPLVQIAAGGEQSFALSVSGGVFSWGRNDCGQLGLGDTTDRHTPNPVHSLDMKKTIHISCGKDHTAILTKDGEVFTFGCGQYGQLGHNSFSDELCPRLVAEPQGSKVIKIACGRHHTLVMTDSKKVYSFGCGEQGQLGHGEESHQSVPLPVQLPQDAIDVPQIRDIYAGGNCSFATCSSTEDIHEGSNSDSMNKVQHCLDGLIDRWTSEHDSKSWEKIKQEIQRTFSSASCVNQSFLEQSRDKHFQTSPTYSGLNLSVARRNFKKLVKKNNVLAEVEAAVTKLIPSLNEKPVGVEGLRIYLLLIELLHVIQKHKQPESTNLTKAVAAVIVRLSADSLQVIGDWWSSLSASTMIEYIDVWKQTLSVILSLRPVPRNTGVKNLLLVLQYLYNANSRTAEAGRVPDNNFCLLIDQEFLKEDLWLWRSWSQHKNVPVEPLILCSFPIVMDLQTRKNVFEGNTECTMMETMGQSWWDIYWQCGREALPEKLLLRLDLMKASVLEDAFEQLAAVDHSDYKKLLVVYFDANNHHFHDDNLHKKDFFHEVFHKMFSAETGMFIFNDSKTLAWFPSRATQDEKSYFLFGVLCGLALFYKCIIHLPFPLVLFKKLLGVKPSLEDMMEFSPDLGKHLHYILQDCSDDGIEKLYLDFIINWDKTDIDLDPDNPEKTLTSQNKKEFVDAYVNYAFNTSVVRLFQEFDRGFFQVCDRDLVKLFRPKELQEVIVGKDFHDWTKLKQNTIYVGVYHAGHPTIQMFWEVFDELTEDQKTAFLWFLTGFERVPILGVDTIKMTVEDTQIDANLTYDWYYPKAHTCNSTLELPIYSTKEIMRDKLTETLSKKRN
ncbi:probable E3 ubiquitin-protein ligase HERC4 [Scomber scombrus]|uniref:probable E3 ubiquitin-protein ligase HERC4 n=1 Tax=Scomber scombrus TaxID=13677 RepID=UPI002DDAEC85|nr:probable E3 ubiquitin-protein ligase HERC4 [Scomber scombrus]